ncbi:MAG: aminotransferase class I/II-fold pyridoxal phosphate-dependent enzyme, partial [Terriglobales bacterium]
LKLAWIAGLGPEPALAEAFARLEVVNDLFLSASAPAQLAAAAALAARHAIQAQILERLQMNLAALDSALARLPSLQRLRVEGGWTVLLRLPRIHSDAAWAERLVERAGVLTHPGHFYGMTEESHLALSLIPPPAEFAAGIARLCAAAAAELTADS